MAEEENLFLKGIKAGTPPKQKRCGGMNHVTKCEYAMSRWRVDIAPEIEPGDLLVSDFWHGTHKFFHGGDLIECYARDRFFAELLVQDCGVAHVTLIFLRVVEIEPAHQPEADLPEGYSVSFVGPAQLWGVFRGTQLVQAMFPTKTAAREWLTMPGRAASMA